MYTRIVVLSLWLCAICGISNAQKLKTKSVTKASPADYHEGVVWVKVKSQFKEILTGISPSGRSATLGATSIKPFVTKPVSAVSGRIGPEKQNIDISQYFTIGFDRSQKTEDFIAGLYATGYFEVVEPVYKVAPFQTPNDPSITQQAYLDVIKAREAWDITQGSETMIIGIVDTGGDLDHPDLQDKIYINPNDPIDGIDNDNDGFIDDYHGWDFSGADLALIGTPGFIGDNNPSVSTGNLFSHGSMVAGCAAASTNNGIGISAIGYKTKLLFTKHFADNQPDANSNYSSDLYAGILYAATHGARIINCSWGGYNPSTIAQDIIKYVTLDLGCLIIAAAGNSNVETPIFPASYDYVLSVASSNNSDVRSPYSNYGKTIDILAPGQGIYSTSFNDSYTTDQGTSFSAPIVSGAAALVWTRNPDFTPLQVAEQLRVSADESIYAQNPAYLNKLGKGRLNVLKALTIQSPSIRASNQRLVNDSNITPEPGQRARLFFDFTNYLQASTAALKATISSNSPYITIARNTFNLGVLQTNTTVSNSAAPFEIQLLPSLPVDQPVEILITYTDGSYQDYQLISVVIPSYVDIRENNIITSLAANGRIAYGNTETQSNGSGFIYGEERLAYEMGLIIGTSSTSIYDNLRSTGGMFNLDFTAGGRLSKSTPGQRSYSEVSGAFLNDDNPTNASISVSYQSLVWDNDPYRDFIILEYKVQNRSATAISGLYMALFADWDIVNNGAADRAGWNADNKLGYVYAAAGGPHPQTGIQILTGTPQYYAIDNDNSIPGNPFGIYDGFADAEKFTSISSGLSKLTAGDPTLGSDVSHVVGSGPYNIAPGQIITVAFALHASSNGASLLNSAKYADSVYNYTLAAPRPIATSVKVCKGSAATLSAAGAQKFKWYRTPTGGTAVLEGSSITTRPLDKDTVLYVSNADKSYESIRVPVSVSIVAIPEVDVSGLTTFCDGGTVTLTSTAADEYTWSNGQKTQSIAATMSGQYHVTVRYGSKSCTTLTPVIVTVHAQPSSSFTMIPEIPSSGDPVSFVAEASQNVTWLWTFGDGTSSDLRTPIHTYSEIGDFMVTLRVTSIHNCTSMSSKFLGTITETEPLLSNTAIYPNPVAGERITFSLPDGLAETDVELIDALGRTVARRKLSQENTGTMDVTFLNNGVYIFKVTVGKYSLKHKIVIAR